MSKLLKLIGECTDNDELTQALGIITKKLSVPTVLKGTKAEYITVRCSVNRETDKAFLLSTYAPVIMDEVWFPKSQIASTIYYDDYTEMLISSYIWNIKVKELTSVVEGSNVYHNTNIDAINEILAEASMSSKGYLQD